LDNKILEKWILNNKVLKMAVTKAITANPYVNNGGTIPHAGNVGSDNPITNVNRSLIQGYTSRGVGGTKPVLKNGGNVGTDEATTSRAFAFPMAAGKFIMTRYGFVGGSASTFLNSGASDFGRRSIHVKTNRRSYHITSWNYETGAATKGAATNDDFGSDHAAIPTRAIPGELTFTAHGMAATGALAVPLNDDYEAKTG
jgi:hypothetical protein